MLQIKHIFLSLLLLSFNALLFGQGNWILALSATYTPVGTGDALYFNSTNGTVPLFFDETGKRLELPKTVKKALGYHLFLIEEDTLMGLVDAEKGKILPAAYDNIEVLGPNFFTVDSYGSSAVLDRSNKQLVPYTTKPIIPCPMGADTMLIKFSLHPDAKATGFLKNGKTLDEAAATALYPKDQAVRRAALTRKSLPSTQSVFYDKGKAGVKSKDGQVVLAAEYDEVRPGYPGYFAVRKGKEWGLMQL